MKDKAKKDFLDAKLELGTEFNSGLIGKLYKR